jgi:hypothetical protein
MEEAMQRDLQTFFGYEAKVETRMCPYWKLIATDQAKIKLKTKGGPPFFKGIVKASFTARNWDFGNLIRSIRDFNDGIFFDETGITGNVDISMDCIMTDLNDIRKSLQTNGLDLVPAEKPMKVLVISDPR